MSAELTLTVGAVAHGGHFVARVEEGEAAGRVVFVRHALPGERVRVALREADPKSALWRGDAVDVARHSQHRVEHFWPEADALKAYAEGVLPVGGAEFGHISLPEQRRLKAAVLAEQLRRLGGLAQTRWAQPLTVESADGEGDGLAWRSRVSFAVTPQGHLGMYAHRSRNVVAIRDMPLAAAAIRGLGLWDEDWRGIDRVDVVLGNAASGVGRPLLALSGSPGVVHRIATRWSSRASIAHKLSSGPVANPVANNAAKEPEGGLGSAGSFSRVSGRSWVMENVGGRPYRVSGEGFWQIHRNAPEILIGAVAQALEGRVNTGDSVADLYAGAGLFTALLADVVGSGGKVYSIEASPVTSRDAKRNFHAQRQVAVLPMKVERALAGVSETLRAVVLDPPRTGAGREVVTRLAALKPESVVYVSCDSASFARDVAYFADAGWQLTDLRAFDLYPHTHHLETVALLVRS